jgi:hypothetical protein
MLKIGEYFLYENNYYRLVGVVDGYIPSTRLLITRFKKKLITVDILGRDPEHSKEYDRYNVYELEPFGKIDYLDCSDEDLIKYISCDEYVYEKIL